MPRVKIFGANPKQVMHVAWVRALNWYLHSQPAKLRQLGEGIAILSKSGQMAHAVLLEDNWLLLSNPWFKDGVPGAILDRVVHFILKRTKQKQWTAVRDQAISFYRKVYLATREANLIAA